MWNTLDGSLRLWTHSKRIKERFEEIVHETWGVRVVPKSPYTLVLAHNETPEAAVALLDVEPANLATA